MEFRKLILKNTLKKGCALGEQSYVKAPRTSRPAALGEAPITWTTVSWGKKGERQGEDSLILPAKSQMYPRRL